MDAREDEDDDDDDEDSKRRRVKTFRCKDIRDAAKAAKEVREVVKPDATWSSIGSTRAQQAVKRCMVKRQTTGRKRRRGIFLGVSSHHYAPHRNHQPPTTVD